MGLENGWKSLSIMKTNADVEREHPLAAKFLNYLISNPDLKQYPSNGGSFSLYSSLDRKTNDYVYENHYQIHFYPPGSDVSGWNPFDILVRILWERRKDVVYVQYKYRNQYNVRVLKFKTEEEFSQINKIIEEGMEDYRKKKRYNSVKEVERKFSNMELRAHLDDAIPQEKQNLMVIADDRGISTSIHSKTRNRYGIKIEKNKNKDEYKFSAKIRVNLPLPSLLKTLKQFFDVLPITPKEKKLYIDKTIDFDSKQ